MESVQFNRRQFLTLSAAGVLAGSTRAALAAPARTEDGISWYDVRD